MITISENNLYLTVITTFTVEPQHQHSLMDVLTQTTNTIKQVKGFISSSLLKSTDNTKVILYTQWQSQEDYNKSAKDYNDLLNLKEVLPIATFKSQMYYVMKTISPSPKDKKANIIVLPEECGDTLWDDVLQ